VVTFERFTLLGLSTSPPKQPDLRSERWNELACRLGVLPTDALANILNRWIRRCLHLAVIRDREAGGQERRHIGRALLVGGGS
jgi:hypothetical protein